MNPDQNPLDQLKDIHLPTEINWWPLAPGWWVVMALALLALVFLWMWWKKSHKRTRRIKLIMTAVDALEAEHDLNDQEWIGCLSALLRRLAINMHGRKESAGLVGKEWLSYLDKSGNTDQFSQGVGQVLASSPYQESVKYDRSELLALTRQWLKAQAKKGDSHA